MSNGPKILLLDIETAPNKAYVWGTNRQFVSHNYIVEPGYTLCWAAKWLDDPDDELLFYSVYHDGEDEMVDVMYELIEEADAVIHYNGTKFDMPKLHTEFLLHGYTPPAPYKQIDLYRVVRSEFSFPSYKLDYVAQALGLGGKVAHAGMELWKQCMAGEQDAWDIMEEYNVEDVLLLERLYDVLLPWIKIHPNFALYVDEERPVCPNCGSFKLQKRGTSTTATMIYQRYQCQECGKWSRDRKNSTPDNVKENTLVTAR